MKDEDELLEEETLDEDLLDFEFDDLPAEGIEATNGDPIPDEEIIDLVDVVEEGPAPGELELDPGLEDLSITVDEEKAETGDEPEPVSDDFTLTMEPDDFIKEIDDMETDLSLEMESDSESVVSDLESFTEPDLELDLEGSDLESLVGEESDLELEDLVEPDPGSEPDTVPEVQDTFEEADAEPAMPEMDVEATADEMPPTEAEDSAEATLVQEEEESMAELGDTVSRAVEATGTEPASVEPRLEISQGRIEAIIREVVEEVVERVARETMTDVAKKVIGEAIDALKNSLESPSEE